MGDGGEESRLGPVDYPGVAKQSRELGVGQLRVVQGNVTMEGEVWTGWFAVRKKRTWSVIVQCPDLPPSG